MLFCVRASFTQRDVFDIHGWGCFIGSSLLSVAEYLSVVYLYYSLFFLLLMDSWAIPVFGYYKQNCCEHS